MVISPEQLTDENNPTYLNEISQLEALIDSWCSKHYTGVKGEKLPLLPLDVEPRKIVQNKLISMYLNANWILSFEKTEDEPVILIREGRV